LFVDALIRTGEGIEAAGQRLLETCCPSRVRLQFDPAEITPLADRFPPGDDAPVAALGEAAALRGYYTRGEFLAVCEWKSPRSRPLVAQNSRAAVTRATLRALASPDERDRIGALLELRGVGVPTASVLLHFVNPAAYPILDVRALESLGVKGRSTYPVAFWLEYLEACRALAATHGVSLRTLDKALWQYSKEASEPPARSRP
jgi:hypothetical protein